MKKIILLVFLFLTTPVLFAQTMPDAFGSIAVPRENQPLYITNDLRITPKMEHEENKEQKYTIEITYPQLEGDNLSQNDQLFNKTMAEIAHQEAEQFKKYVTADMPHMQTLPEQVQKNTFNLDYDLDIVKPSENNYIVSVRLAIEGLQAGRAHPYHTHRVLNFDLSTGKVIELEDLFKKNSKYLNVIADYCNKTLNEKLEDKMFIAEGTKPIAKNYKNWNLENDGILITFDEYQVAPYSHGAQEVNISFEVLKHILSSEVQL